VVDRYTYSNYGKSGDEGDAGFPFRFTGQKLDPETGLYYYKTRYYSPDLGRFLQVDPIGYADQINLYAYVGNDPVNATDPTGMIQTYPIRSNNYTIQSVGMPLARTRLTRPYERYYGRSLRHDELVLLQNYLNARQAYMVFCGCDTVWATGMRPLPSEAEVASLQSAAQVAERRFTSTIKKSASAMDRNGLTKVGRSFQKHSSRKQDPAFNYTGRQNAQSYNEAGLRKLNQLLKEGGMNAKTRGNKIEFRNKDGSGFSTTRKGEFIGFLSKSRRSKSEE
jgi:RHS repeat-associated protein